VVLMGRPVNPLVCDSHLAAVSLDRGAFASVGPADGETALQEVSIGAGCRQA
jgi:hypothetical protein